MTIVRSGLENEGQKQVEDKYNWGRSDQVIGGTIYMYKAKCYCANVINIGLHFFDWSVNQST